MLQELNGKIYRLNVGIAVMNMEGKFWTGMRSESIIPDEELFWQMPQGGMDKGEDVKQTALRELYEETGIKTVKILKTTDWMVYDYPPEVRTKRQQDGQMQKWVLMLFTGEENEINIHIDNEFSKYKWDSYDNIINNVVPFKKDVYKNVFEEFKSFIV